MPKAEIVPPDCPYCGAQSKPCDGRSIYPNLEKLWEKRFFKCPNCRDVYVGTHDKSGAPLGALANKELRTARTKAHAAFDPLWRRKAENEGITFNEARGLGYKWLADQLGIDGADCHIGHMDVEACLRIVEIIENR